MGVLATTRVQIRRFAGVSDHVAALGRMTTVVPAEDQSTHEVDWSKKYTGSALAVVQPGCVEEVAEVIKYAGKHGIGVVPQGGNTGLVGGGVPRDQDIVVNMSRMRRISDFDTSSGVITAEAGVTLAELEAAAAQHGFRVPLDLGARGSCHIGGNIATNAGGIRVVRYGSLHGYLRGLRVVDGAGRTLDLRAHLAKDNVGLHLPHLFLGSEGSLGVITDVCLATVPAPPHSCMALLAAPSFPAAVRIMQRARRQLQGSLSALEFMDRAALKTVLQHTPNTRDPLPTPFPFYVLVEVEGGDAPALNGELENTLWGALAAEEAVEGVVADSSARCADLWALRENVAPAASTHGLVLKYDVSLPAQRMHELVCATQHRLADAVAAGQLPGASLATLGSATHGELVQVDPQDIVVMGYGHIGDGNLHLNVSIPWEGGSAASPLTAPVQELLEPWVFEWVLAAGGSVSAEHGVGQAKVQWVGRARSPEAVQAMRDVKRAFDPLGIMNPGKVLPQ